MPWGSVEVEREVADWLEGLSDKEFGHVAFTVFRKQRAREPREVARAYDAMLRCRAEDHRIEE